MVCKVHQGTCQQVIKILRDLKPNHATKAGFFYTSRYYIYCSHCSADGRLGWVSWVILGDGMLWPIWDDGVVGITKGPAGRFTETCESLLLIYWRVLKSIVGLKYGI